MLLRLKLLRQPNYCRDPALFLRVVSAGHEPVELIPSCSPILQHPCRCPRAPHILDEALNRSEQPISYMADLAKILCLSPIESEKARATSKPDLELLIAKGSWQSQRLVEKPGITEL